jgi:hypothetical protein
MFRSMTLITSICAAMITNGTYKSTAEVITITVLTATIDDTYTSSA